MAPKTRKKLKLVWIWVVCFIPLVLSDPEPENYVDYNDEDDLPLFPEEDYEETDEYDYYGIVNPQIRGNTNFPNIREVSTVFILC